MAFWLQSLHKGEREKPTTDWEQEIWWPSHGAGKTKRIVRSDSPQEAAFRAVYTKLKRLKEKKKGQGKKKPNQNKQNNQPCCCPNEPWKGCIYSMQSASGEQMGSKCFSFSNRSQLVSALGWKLQVWHDQAFTQLKQRRLTPVMTNLDGLNACFEYSNSYESEQVKLVWWAKHNSMKTLI